MSAATSTMTARLIAEWMSLVGWLRTAVRKDSRALALFADAEDLADEAGDGTIAATAASSRGYLAGLQGRPRGAIRASAAALATPRPKARGSRPWSNSASASTAPAPLSALPRGRRGPVYAGPRADPGDLVGASMVVTYVHDRGPLVLPGSDRVYEPTGKDLVLKQNATL
jgi:hypothetical protein